MSVYLDTGGKQTNPNNLNVSLREIKARHELHYTAPAATLPPQQQQQQQQQKCPTTLFHPECFLSREQVWFVLNVKKKNPRGLKFTEVYDYYPNKHHVGYIRSFSTTALPPSRRLRLPESVELSGGQASSRAAASLGIKITPTTRRFTMCFFSSGAEFLVGRHNLTARPAAPSLRGGSVLVQQQQQQQKHTVVPPFA